MATSAMKNGVDACPDPETLAAYLDGRLTEKERLHIAEHLASCETCYFVFTEAAQTHSSNAPVETVNQKAAPGPRSRWRTTPRVLWSSAAGLAAAASLLIAIGTGRIPWRSAESPELRALVVAVGTDRTIEPRLTGGFAFGPVRAPMRSGEPSPAAVSPDVRIAVARIEKEATAHRTPETLRQLGIAYLVIGDVERAVPPLEEALTQSESDGRTLSDLAAAYLTRATARGDRQELMRALATAERAVGADPRLAEAWFNRAETFERLSLAAQARDAWREYLKVDPDSPWASEARSHLRALDGR